MKSEKDIMTGNKTAEIVGHAFEEGKEELSEILGDSSIRSKIEIQRTRCDNCGSKVLSADDYLVWKCPYCGTASELYKGRELNFLKPDYILPFLIDREHALELLEEWICRRFWIYPAFRRLLRDKENITPEYLPYWMYEAQNVSTFCVRQLNSRLRMGCHSGYLSHDISRIVCPASEHCGSKEVFTLDKIYTDLMTPYSHNSLGNTPVVRWSRDFIEAFFDVRAKYGRLAEQEVRRQTSIFFRKIIYNNNLWANIRYSQILMPRWRAEVKFRGKTRAVVVDGATGCVERLLCRPW